MSEIYGEKDGPSGVAIAALVVGILCWIVNPFYLVCLSAIVLGIIGMTQKNGINGMALAGLILGGSKFVVEIMLYFVTGGTSCCI